MKFNNNYKLIIGIFIIILLIIIFIYIKREKFENNKTWEYKPIPVELDDLIYMDENNNVISCLTPSFLMELVYLYFICAFVYYIYYFSI